MFYNDEMQKVNDIRQKVHDSFKTNKKIEDTKEEIIEETIEENDKKNIRKKGGNS